MKKNYIVLSLMLAVVMIVVSTSHVTSNLVSPPAGNTNDAFTGTTCAQNTCHPGPATAAAPTDVTLKIGTSLPPSTVLSSSFTYQPNTTYNLGFQILDVISGNNPYYGFQVSILDAATNSAGTLIASNGTNTKLDSLLHRKYLGHKGATSNANWAFKWTSPASSAGPVTFYYSFNTANASTTPPSVPEGTIRYGSITIQPAAGTGINDIADKLSDLNVFPNPVSNEFSMSFNLKQTEQVSASVYSLDGKLAQQLMNDKVSNGNFNQAFNIQNLAAGIYLVKLNVGEATVTQKIIKQ